MRTTGRSVGQWLRYGFVVFCLFPFASQARVSATVNYWCFPAETKGGRMLVLFEIDGQNLQYKKLKNGFYQGTASFAIAINDSVNNFYADRLDLNTALLKDSSEFNQRFSARKVISLPSGSFSVEMLVFDPNEADSTREKISFNIDMQNAEAKTVLSDLLFVEPDAFTHSETVFDLDVKLIRSSDFYTRTDTVLQFYSEVHGVINRIPAGTPMISRVRIMDRNSGKSIDELGKIKRVKVSENMAFKTELFIRDLPSGNYSIVWDLIDTSGVIAARSYRYFRKSNPGFVSDATSSGKGMADQDLAGIIKNMTTDDCRHVVASLLPIASSSEQATIEYLRKKGTDQELRKYLSGFWTRKSNDNAANELQKYRELIALAEKKYATQTMKAYQTERGRTMLQYGKPDIIENEYSDRNRKAMQNLNTIPYEIWYYYSVESPVKQSDVMFVFVQQNRGNNNYRLIHSSAIGEVRNGEWRSLVENNATYNFDRMNPNDRNDQVNPRMAR